MATFSGGIGQELKLSLKFNGIDNAMLDKIIRNEIVQVEELGKATMKELREKIVNDWFKKFNGKSMNEATEYHATHGKGDTVGKVVITITSFVNINSYEENYHSADLWNKNHKDEVKMDYTPGEYILGLQYDDGIIGLPEKATARETGWENNNFHQQDPLQEVLEAKLAKQWQKKINQNYKKLK